MFSELFSGASLFIISVLVVAFGIGIGTGWWVWQKDAAQTKDELTGLIEDNALLTKEVQALRKASINTPAATALDGKENLEEKNQMLHAELAEMQAEREKLLNHQHEAEAQINVVRKELDETRYDAQRKETELSSLRLQLASLEYDKATAITQRDQLQLDLDELKQRDVTTPPKEGA
jgi:septal ring factor EnvC (AmiA/AmiB activator)